VFRRNLLGTLRHLLLSACAFVDVADLRAIGGGDNYTFDAGKERVDVEVGPGGCQDSRAQSELAGEQARVRDGASQAPRSGGIVREKVLYGVPDDQEVGRPGPRAGLAQRRGRYGPRP
jgi:hypothetical protein